MDTYAQELILEIHKKYGVADSDIAEYCGVSRKHINQVKNGQKGASEQLINSIAEYICEKRELRQQLTHEEIRAIRKHYEWHEKETAPAYYHSKEKSPPVIAPPAIHRTTETAPPAYYLFQNVTYHRSKEKAPAISAPAKNMQVQLWCVFCNTRDGVKRYLVAGKGEYFACKSCASKNGIV